MRFSRTMSSLWSWPRPQLGEKMASSKGDLDQRKAAIEEMLKPMKDSALEKYTDAHRFTLEKDNSQKRHMGRWRN